MAKPLEVSDAPNERPGSTRLNAEQRDRRVQHLTKFLALVAQNRLRGLSKVDSVNIMLSASGSLVVSLLFEASYAGAARWLNQFQKEAFVALKEHRKRKAEDATAR